VARHCHAATIIDLSAFVQTCYCFALFDLVIKNGRVIDGSGGPSFDADVGVSGDMIVEVARGLSGGRKTIDATGLSVCPGFVDMHAHSDLQLLANPLHESKVHQGVTLELIGQDGLSYAPVTDAALAELRVQLSGWNDDPPGFDWNWRTVGEYLDRLDAGIAVNAAYLVPHGTLRIQAMGADDRAPTDRELGQMQRLLATAISDGAVGLSAGLTYTPGMYADDDELVALCSVMRGTGAFYCPHHRNYGAQAIESYSDCIEIARLAQVPLHLPHTSLPFAVNRGRAPDLLERIDVARSAGVDITLDLYPYTAGSTALYGFLPGWTRAGGTDATLERLRDPGLRERLRVDFEVTGSDGFFGVPVEWETIIVSDVATPDKGQFVGSSIAAGATLAEQRPIDFLCELLIDQNLKVGAINHVGNEDTLREILQHPVATVGSDGILVGARPHPRGWGTFPRILGVYVREEQILTLEEAVRKMTSLPARRLGLDARGFVQPGMHADLVCFDPDTVRDTATYEEPKSVPVGIPFVAVNGAVVVADGKHTGVLAGRSVRLRS
jgi:N-acyl-D-amino-acid deacylase